MKLLVAFALILCPASSFIAFQRQTQPRINLSDLERRIHELVNAEREKNKLSPLQFDTQLAGIARDHSSDMSRRNYFDHVDREGRDPTDRGRRAGYTCRKVYAGFIREGLAENIYQGSLYSRIRITGDQRFYEWYSLEEIAREAVRGWMASPGHRRNILEEDYENEGLGIAVSAEDKIYVTQLFC